MTFTDNEPVQAEALGYPVNVMKVSSYYKLVSTGVIAGTNLAQSNPKLVEAFVKATLQGEAYTLEHPDAAFAIALKRMPELDAADQAIQRKVLTARLAYQQQPKGHPLGWVDPAAWPTTVKFLAQIGLIKANPPAPTSLYTNKFIAQANVHVTK
jgi:NitT/TauT family transport system substrate-binding protein